MSKYEKEIDGMTFSFSRCHSFEGCKYEWYLNYILVDEDKHPIYENEQNFYAAFGKLCHEILEKIFKKEMTIEQGTQYYIEHFDEETGGFDISPSTINKYYEAGLDYFTSLSLDWLENFEILGVEMKCVFHAKKVPLIAYIDLLLKDKKTDNIIVIDHKSAQFPLGKKGKILKRKEDDFEAYKRQLYLYSCWVHDQYGVYPTILAWNYFKDKKWLQIPFDKKEYDEAIDWVEKIVDEMKKEEAFAPRQEHFYCNNLCAFRHSCEYNMEDDE